MPIHILHNHELRSKKGEQIFKKNMALLENYFLLDKFVSCYLQNCHAAA